MLTLQVLLKNELLLDSALVWYLSELSEYKGKQELYTHQAPQKLKALKEHAIIESSVSSNRLEGIEIDQKRIGTVIFGRPLYRDRNEEEIAGYRKALTLIHGRNKNLQISTETIKTLHKLTRGEIWDAGKFKEKDSDIVEKYLDGRERIRFKTVSAAATGSAMEQLITLTDEAIKEVRVPPLITIVAFNLDFLCIHPFRDGNGRVSRLLLLLQLYKLGFDVGHYISIEKLIEENKERYYETLEQSSQGWHEGAQNPWPYIQYILSIIRTAYKEFERRVGQVSEPKGAKTEAVIDTINKQLGLFSVAEIKKLCPSVGLDMIRKIIKTQKKQGVIECLGRGKTAKWQKIV